MIENSELSVGKTLLELDINRGIFYEWYSRYRELGYNGLVIKKSSPRKLRNKILEPVKKQVVDIALERLEKSPRELAWHIATIPRSILSWNQTFIGC